MRSIIVLCASMSLAACATTEPGWTGEGAVPFDRALAECQDEVNDIAREAERNAALEECMAAKGWTRR